MKRASDNDIYHQMANYDFETPIKVSCILEECNADQPNTIDYSELPDKPVQHAENNNSTTELLTTLPSNQNCYNNVSFNENTFNTEHERRIHSNETIQQYSNVQSPHAGYEMPNYYNQEDYSPLGEMFNITNKESNLTPDERTQYINLLDTVSENLINIAKYYHYNYFNYVKSRTSREKYLEYKCNRFEQCYSVIVSVFLPQEHNQRFIRHFIIRTIELARRKSFYHHMSVETLEVLVNSMFQWAKQRKKYLEARDRQLHLMSRPPPESPTAPVPPVPSSLDSNFNFNAREPTIRPPPPPAPPQHAAPSALPVPPSSTSNVNCNFNVQDPLRRPPTVSIPPSLNINYNSLEMRGSPPVLVLPHALPETLVPPLSNPNSNYTIPERMSRPPPMPLESPVLSIPTSSNSNYYCNAPQPMSTAPPVSFVPTALAVQPSSNSNFYCNARQSMSEPTPVSVSRVPQPVPPSSSNSISDINTGQQINTPPQLSHVRPTPKSTSIATTRVISSHQNTSIPAVVQKNNICLFTTGPPGSQIRISIDPAVAKTVIGDKVRNVPHQQRKRGSKKIYETSNPTVVSTNSTRNSSTHYPLPHIPYNHNPSHPPRTSNADGINTSVQQASNSNQFWSGARQNDNTESQPPSLRVSRSVSRDSGFGSPVLCSLLTNDTNTPYLYSTDNQELTPEITHVTSLNPDALYLASGTCKICGSTTKNVCIVCYNEYYCGSVCQTLDWPVHQKECKAR